ncbi:tetratricopeptide repeat protein, partial [Runella defluvii]
MKIRTYRIFLASSFRLEAERQAFRNEIGRINDLFAKKDTHLQLDIWEKFDAANDPVRKQDFYNNHIQEADIFVILYWGELGAFTTEEYQLAQQLFQKKGKPRIYIFKKKGDVSFELRDENVAILDDLEAIWYAKDKAQWPWEFEHPTDFVKKLSDDILGLFDNPEVSGFSHPIFHPAKLLSPNAVSEPSVFLGREDELRTIREKLDRGGRLMLINAEGGIGKTTLAAKYWHDSLHHYKHNAWLFCEGGIINALKDLAPKLNLDLAGMDEAQQVAALKQALSELHDDFLLVLDNANDENEIKAFRQHFDGFHWHILLTSRCAGVLDPKQELPISHLPPPLAKALFESYYREESPEFDALLDRLLRALQYHTLSVELFAKTMKQLSERGLSFAAFVQELETQGLTLGKKSFSIVTDYTTNTHIEAINSDQILDRFYDFAKLSEDERHWLVNMALLPAEEYNFLFLCALFGQDSMEFSTLHDLARKGWLSKTEANFKINPVIQAIALRKNQPTLATDSETLLTRLNALLANDGSVFLHLRLPQAEPLVRPIAHLTKCLAAYPSRALTFCSYCAALYYRSVGDPVAELQSYLNYQGLIQALRQANPNNPDFERELALSHSLLGDFYLRLGDAKKAEENYSEGLRINRKLASLDEQNSRWQQDLATSLSKMGDFYLRLGEAKKAEENYSEALARRRKLASLDEQNSRWQQDLATSLSKMGDFYLRLGEAKKAEENYSEDLKISRKLASLDEQNTSWQQDLATSLSKMGDFYLRLGE